MESLKFYHPGITTIGILMNCFLLSFCTIKTHIPTFLPQPITLTSHKWDYIIKLLLILDRLFFCAPHFSSLIAFLFCFVEKT